MLFLNNCGKFLFTKNANLPNSTEMLTYLEVDWSTRNVPSNLLHTYTQTHPLLPKEADLKRQTKCST